MRVRRTHVLDGLGLRMSIAVDSLLLRGAKRDRATPPVPDTDVNFELELSEFGDDWAIAVQRALGTCLLSPQRSTR